MRGVVKAAVAGAASVATGLLMGLLIGSIAPRRMGERFGLTQGDLSPQDAVQWAALGIVLGVLLCYFVFVRKVNRPEG
jgi:hypothetical protein